jgi:hypothetical protein
MSDTHLREEPLFVIELTKINLATAKTSGGTNALAIIRFLVPHDSLVQSIDSWKGEFLWAKYWP